MTAFDPLIRCHYCGDKLSDALGENFSPCECKSFQQSPMVDTELLDWAETREEGFWPEIGRYVPFLFLTTFAVMLGIRAIQGRLANFDLDLLVQCSLVASVFAGKVIFSAWHRWHDSEKKWRAAVEKAGLPYLPPGAEPAENGVPTDQTWLIPPVFIDYCRESGSQAATC